MKLKLIAIGALLATAGASNAADTTIKMPSADILMQRLEELGMKHFMEKTNIITQLADQQKAPLGVAMAIEEACADYVKYLTQGPEVGLQTMKAFVLFSMMKPFLLVSLLREHPEALKALKKEDLYDPKSKL